MRRRCHRGTETDLGQRARITLLIDRAETADAREQTTTLKRTNRELAEELKRQTDKTVALIKKLLP